jgi:hypothetical protein
VSLRQSILKIIARLSQDYRKIIARLSQDYRKIIARLSQDYRKIIARLLQDYRKIFVDASNDQCLFHAQTFKVNSCHIKEKEEEKKTVATTLKTFYDCN